MQREKEKEKKKKDCKVSLYLSLKHSKTQRVKDCCERKGAKSKSKERRKEEEEKISTRQDEG